MLNIGSERECLFDDHIIDTEKTTASFRLHQPVPQEIVLRHDAPWEGDGSDYHNFFFDDKWHGVNGEYPNGCYRMYYLAWKTENPVIRVAYAESADGLRWSKPSLGMRSFEGSLDNNLILDLTDFGNFDNFMVFRDDNPACPPEKRYKGIAACLPGLWAWVSPDGLHFTKDSCITENGDFDSLNVAFWDRDEKIYRCFFRSHYNIGPDDPHVVPLPNDNSHVRFISVTESKDFVTWTEPEFLSFDDGEHIPLYTNVIQKYFRSPKTLIGFPTRYIERQEWNGSFDELGGRESRLERMKMSVRYGLAITDCAFIVSRNGHDFHRYTEAFIPPLEEDGTNWVYGDCYPIYGLTVTKSARPGAPDEISMYMKEKQWTNTPALLRRYTIRMDGFASMYAGGSERRIITKPFVYSGDTLWVNFATSARGWMYFTLIDQDGGRYESEETFGNTIDRRVHFADEDAVKKLSGKPVTLEVRMIDADLYSFRFAEER